MSLMKYIKSDLARLTKDVSVKSFFRWYFFSQGSTFPHDVWFRISQNCKKNALKKYTIGLLAYIKERKLSYKYGIHANANMHVGVGLRIVHCDGIYLNCKSIGDNFTVFQNVTLGAGGDSGIPTVENNVTIYTGAVIVGDIILHSGCVVGANAYVDKDVPENAIVVGCPARIIKYLEK